MSTEIRPATLRDLCYTASNARAIDREELLAAGPRSMTECGAITFYMTDKLGGCGFCVWLDGNPEYAFGFTRQSELTPWLFSAWAWGSEKTDLCMIEMSRWARPNLVPILDELGAQRIEARSIHHHHESHRWLEWLGFKRETDLVDWGRNRTRFVQFAWVRSEFSGLGPHGNVLRRLTGTTATASADPVDRSGR